MMKRLFLGLCLFSYLLANAQIEDPKTLFETSGQEHNGWYFSPEVKVHFYGRDLSTTSSGLMGGQFGFVLNRSFMIGFGGYGSLRRLNFKANYPQLDRSGKIVKDQHPMGLGYGYGGVYLGYVINSNEPIHFIIPLFVGLGTSNEYEIEIDGDHGTTINSPSFTIVEPSIIVELNLQKTFRLAFGLNYHYIDTSRFEQLNKNALSNIGLSLAFKIGKF